MDKAKELKCGIRFRKTITGKMVLQIKDLEKHRVWRNATEGEAIIVMTYIRTMPYYLEE